MNKVLDGPSSRNQLQLLAQQIGGGAQHFEKLGVSATGISSGTADFYIDIDFGNRKVGTGNSRVEGSLLIVVPQTFLFHLNDA